MGGADLAPMDSRALTLAQDVRQCQGVSVRAGGFPRFPLGERVRGRRSDVARRIWDTEMSRRIP
jgi:hypothetical protein